MTETPTKNQHGGRRAGSGRPPIDTEPRVPISGSVPQSLATRTREHAQASGETVSSVIAEALEQFLG